MSIKNTGKEYESMVETVYVSLCHDDRFSKVERNVKLRSLDGERQIDVLVTHIHAGIEYKTVIECRNYSGKLDVKHIDAFSSVLADVNANKGIIVSKRGFSKTAIQKANRLGIGLCIVDSANELLKSLAIEVPILIVVVEPNTVVNIGLRPKRDVRINQDQYSIVNDVQLLDLVLKDLQQGSIIIPRETATIPWSPKQILPPFFVRDVHNEPIEIEWFEVSVTLNVSYLLGKTNDLPDFVSHVQLGNEVATVFVPDEFRFQINKSFVRYRSYKEIPSWAKKESIVTVFPPQADWIREKKTSVWRLNL